MSAYANALLAIIRAGETTDKAALLATIAPPAEGETWDLPALPDAPGRPPGLRIVADPPRRRRGLGDPHQRLRFLHAIWHIEVSAIDLAVLLCLRSPGTARALHVDFLRVAQEEATHAGLVADLLIQRGHPPGTDAVHHRLWTTALAAGDVLEQLVLVPRFLEARGLDVSAGLLPRLIALDPEMHAVVARIYHDEIRHVGLGTHWHRALCSAAGLDPEAHFAGTVQRHCGDQIPGPYPLDLAGRTSAGFSPRELALLSSR